MLRNRRYRRVLIFLKKILLFVFENQEPCNLCNQQRRENAFSRPRWRLRIWVVPSREIPLNHKIQAKSSAYSWFPPSTAPPSASSSVTMMIIVFSVQCSVFSVHSVQRSYTLHRQLSSGQQSPSLSVHGNRGSMAFHRIGAICRQKLKYIWEMDKSGYTHPFFRQMWGVVKCRLRLRP